ncbi:MAG: SH3 domain-containing protein [Clostridia bacterium]
MQKPTGSAVAARAVAAVAEGISYNELDCLAFVEYVVNECMDALPQGERGAHMAYAGSNAMARSCAAAGRLWPLAQAKEAGRLQPGAALFIWDGIGGEPEKYKADGIGNFSHVGFYVGKNALVDEDKNGNERNCDVVHSSATMERVAGSTLGNAWTHVGWFAEVEESAEGEPGAGWNAGSAAKEANASHSKDAAVLVAEVTAENGLPVKLRAKASAQCALYWKVPCGERVAVLNRGGEWCKVRRHSRVGYIMTRYLILGEE